MPNANRLILGDNLDVLKSLPNESVDLIYLDPPFFSNRSYEVIWGDKGEMRSFEDRWSGGVDKYIDWLRERVQEMHRVLKATGSFFLHCDWHANAYIRVYILDKVFGKNNFRNDIIWKRSDAHNDAKLQFSVIVDSIFFYVKSDQFKFRPQHGKYTEKSLRDRYQYLEFGDKTIRKMTKEENVTQVIPQGARRFTLGDMSAPFGGGMAQIMKETGKPRGWYVYKGYHPPKNGWRYSPKSMARLDAENNLYFPHNKNGRITLKRYLDEQDGPIVTNIWDDIGMLRGNNKEGINYPTQKPIALLERIINCASNPDDVVLDPFVGGGTSILAAERLGRRWIGIDQSVHAIKVTEMRLSQPIQLTMDDPLDYVPFVVELHKHDYDSIFNMNPYDFQCKVVAQMGGIPGKKGGDFGIDGRLSDGRPIQVKQSEKIGREDIDSFLTAAKRFNKTLFEKCVNGHSLVGEIVAFSFTKGFIQEIARLKNEDGIEIGYKQVQDILPYANKPKVTIEVLDGGLINGKRKVKFEVTAISTGKVELFAWDFGYDGKKMKPSVLRDLSGKQTRTFDAGTYSIAVKAVDENGLEAIEVIKLRVNGGVHRD